MLFSRGGGKTQFNYIIFMPFIKLKLIFYARENNPAIFYLEIKKNARGVEMFYKLIRVAKINHKIKTVHKYEHRFKNN